MISPDFVKKMDACSIFSSEISDIVNKRMETINETFNDRLEKDRVRMQLSKREYGSVFGKSDTETAVSQWLKGFDDQDSNICRSSSNRADAEADLAAKMEQAKVTQMLQDHQAELDKTEIEWKLEETKMLAEIRGKLKRN